LLFWCGCVAQIGDAPAGSAPAPGGMGLPPPSGGGGVSGGGGSPGAQPPARCQNRTIHPGRAPVRRLTRFEYNNTVRDLLGDTTEPAVALPSDEIANGFGNDAEALSVSSLLVEQYGTVAEGIATRATQGGALTRLLPCAATVMPASEESCTRTFVGSFAARAYRRSVTQAETDELVALARSVRGASGFASGIAAVIEVVLQSPDFLYRLEWGAPDPAHPELRRPTGDEMATRLSYLFWGTMPDDKLRAAAKAGELSTAEGVLVEASRLVEDPRARPVVRFFFDSLLPISGLGALERDRTLFPTYSGTIGALMREETQRLLEDEIFAGSGNWPGVLLSDHTFVNGPLAAFYGMSGVSGDTFRKVPLDDHRLGLLTLGGLMAGTTPSNTTNPVLRGSFVVRKLMCRTIPLPTGDILAKVKPPPPYSGKTARERYTAHKADPICASCHAQMDPVGLAFENFNPVGLWRDTENGVTIDASAVVPGTDEMVAGPQELIRKLAALDDVNDCLASHWMDFAYGQSAGARDECVQAGVVGAFAKSGHDVRKLLLALTQTDEFLYFTPRP
jgi:Protein of unknown function (DUF1592)/Protein of unknown function (DUF1588)/Protein of unknown function (DUF1587)/Protein of unknown function (DUF1595)/Protein of unknown function (DUF1585)